MLMPLSHAHAAATQAKPAAKTSTSPSTTSAAITVLVVGDSISAEYGLERGAGWVQHLEAQLLKAHPKARVVNASISGDTTAGGRARLSALLAQHTPSHVVLELGANDALRGLALRSTLDNLVAMTRTAQKQGAQVLIAGMQMPPNYGPTYQKQFRSVFERAAKQTDAQLLPFLLAGVADIKAEDSLKLFQKDLIHPNEKAQATMAQNVWEKLQPMLKEAKQSK